jgi:aldose 1-epimerase
VLELVNGAARLLVDAHRGGRIASLRIDGFEVVVGDSPGASPLMWGCFPMAPWAGRLRGGQFTYDGQTFSAPLNHPPHALHGLLFDHAWTVAGPREIAADLPVPWPFGGRVVQRFALTPTRLHCTIEVHAAQRPIPVCVGWHPWFVRPDQFEFAARSMCRRDAEDIPDGVLITPPPPPPWDDCFVGVSEPVVLRWGGLTLRISSDCEHWMVYDGQDHALCVEPQSGPPDSLNSGPSIVEPSRPFVRRMTWDWGPPR